MEPTTSLTVVLDQVILNSLENVPLGFAYEASNPSLTYYPQVDPFGCVRVCGVPLQAGNDTIIIHATAIGTAGGIAISQVYDLKVPVFAYPASQDTFPDFTASSTEGCGPLSVDFVPGMSAPGLVSTFNWNFGNGNVHTGISPPTQIYSNAGDHVVTLQTVMTVPMLTSLTVSGVNNSWCGDVDEPNLPVVGCVGQPDLYFTVLDNRLALERSAVINNTQSHTWNNLSIPLGFPPFTLRVFDRDAISADDLLGTFTFPNSTGNFTFNQGGTSGQGTVAIQTVHTFIYTDTITVFPTPNTTLSLTADVLCAADMGLANYTWSFNGTLLPGETGPCTTAANGLWSVTGTNAEGCSSTSEFLVVDLGIESGELGRSVRLYPVPNSGRFTVMLEGWGAGRDLYMTVVDPVGRSVHQERFASVYSEFAHTVDLEGLAAGSYHLRINDGARTVVRPFIVRPH